MAPFSKTNIFYPNQSFLPILTCILVICKAGCCKTCHCFSNASLASCSFCCYFTRAFWWLPSLRPTYFTPTYTSSTHLHTGDLYKLLLFLQHFLGFLHFLLVLQQSFLVAPLSKTNQCILPQPILPVLTCILLICTSCCSTFCWNFSRAFRWLYFFSRRAT